MADPAKAIAHTGVAELHHEPSALGLTAPWWVAVAMLVVVGLMLWQKVPALVGRMLDQRIASIRTQLDEAAALRAEAEVLLANAKKRDEASAGDAAAIVSHAEAEAEAIRTKAESDSADLIARRGRMAEGKIAAAERTAVAEVRARAADAAARAAGRIIAEHHDAAADRAMTDRAIAGIGRLN